MVNFLRGVILKKYYYQTIAILTCFISISAIAGDKVAQSLTVSEEGKLFVDITRGVVKIKGWNKNEISVQGELDDAVKELIFKRKGDKTLIKADSKGQKHWGDSSVLKIFMPYKSRLFFKGVDATFTISSIASGVEGKTISGDLFATKIGDHISLSSMGGSIKLINSAGKVKLESVAGDITMEGSYEKANIRSMSGNISLNIGTSDEVKAKTVSGEMLVVGDVKSDAQIKLASVSGDIIYKATKNLDAKCEISSQFGGEISNMLTKDKVKESRMNGRNLSFVSGDGSGSLVMHTISGNVTIDKGMQL